MENSSIVWLAVASIIILLVGGALGVVFQKNQAFTPVANQTAPTALIQKLNSKVIPSIVAYGQVKSISGKVIDLTFGGDDVTVTMRDTATYSAFVPASQKYSATSRKASLEEIKVGSNINITVKVNQQGQLEGISSFIFPATAVK